MATLKDQLLRTLAEMENLRRRTEREIADTRSYAVSGFARDVLSVGDNLSRALSALPAGSSNHRRCGVEVPIWKASTSPSASCCGRWRSTGVRKVDPVGEKFDPNFHQAMFEVPNQDVPSGTVVQVVQSGYKIGDRVLRPALVESAAAVQAGRCWRGDGAWGIGRSHGVTVSGSLPTPDWA